MNDLIRLKAPQKLVRAHDPGREPQMHTKNCEKLHCQASPTKPNPKELHWKMKKRKPRRKKVVHEPHPKHPSDIPKPEDIFLDFDPAPYRIFEDPIYHSEAVRYAFAASRWKPPWKGGNVQLNDYKEALGGRQPTVLV